MPATRADLGCAVALASRTEADCADLAAGIAERFRVPAVGLSCNIADEASVEAAVAGTIDRLGGLDILINNAGASWWGLPQDIPLKGWQKVMDVNVTGTFLACRHAARSEEHTSELQSLMRISYAVFCLKKKNKRKTN